MSNSLNGSKSVKNINYGKYIRETNSYHIPSAEEFEYAKRAGLMFDAITLSHNQAIDWLFEARGKVTKRQVTSAFVASFSSNRLDWRSGLSAYVLALNFPAHSYSKPLNDCKPCPICGDFFLEDPERIDLSGINKDRFTLGCASTPDDHLSVPLLAFHLEQHSLLPEIKPTLNDVSILKEIFNTVSQAKENDTPNDLEKSIASKKLFKSNHWQRRCVLQTLSFCNIIEHPRAQGYTNHFVSPEKRSINNHISEWDYPIRLWKGKFGIHKAALEYWFGEFF
ncbi:hypothetical protein [Siphonobacter sp. SORGH_AS_0500]|uniref:hypothetical protein n=1 Tax=Siphonobacter sp. SORGH_AS_0500 TaxID=1864824 RepID=UPI002866523A|nr:hypothetical protein [Siphonobacter sp. SORGH_AS_0500]MDR6194768.1 hypothetical protein [Siphonobacter sp. SORGH_AS_0500]